MDKAKKTGALDGSATKSEVENFLGVRVLTPLEETSVVGGIKNDHDHDDWGGHTHDHG